MEVALSAFGLVATPFMAWQSHATPLSPFGAAAVNISMVLILAGLPLITLHELGHAIAGKLCNFRIFAVQIGGGPKIFGSTLGATRWSLHALATSGFCQFAPKTAKNLRRNATIAIAAGPLVNLLILSGTIAYFPVGHILNWNALFEPVSFAWILFWGNAWILFWNLLPRDVMLPIGKVPTDGRQLINILKDDGEYVREMHAVYFFLNAQECLEDNKQEAGRWITKGLEIYPGNLSLLNFQAVVLIESGRADEVREKLLPKLEQEDGDPLATACAKNNIAYAIALTGDTEHLAQADQLSKEALATIPDNAALLGTRGAVLVQLGNASEGLEYIERSLFGDKTRQDRAENYCWAALAHAKLGSSDRSQESIERAREYDSECKLLKEAEEHSA